MEAWWLRAQDALQHLHSGLQLFVTPAGGDLMTSSGMHGEHAVKTYIQARYSYISNNFYKKIN